MAKTVFRFMICRSLKRIFLTDRLFFLVTGIERHAIAKFHSEYAHTKPKLLSVRPTFAELNFLSIRPIFAELKLLFVRPTFAELKLLSVRPTFALCNPKTV